MVEDTVGDDTVREQSVPSVTVDLSSGSFGAALGQSPPAFGLSSMVTIVVAPPRQTPPSAGTTVLASTLGAAPSPRVLRRKVLSVKKSTL
jgi:hypothetical protein